MSNWPPSSTRSSLTPQEWVSLAKQAGQKYLVITSKHHDGFCLFKSDETDYNIVDGTPYGRDPLKELAAECAKQGIKLGFYYSQTQDWHHPDGYGNDWDFDEEAKDFDGYIHDYVMPQVTELLTNYGPIGLIWFDTPMIISTQQSQDLLDLCNELQPDCLVCGRLGNELGDYASAGDNMIPSELVDLDWETPATLNDTWGYRSDDHHWKSSEDLIRKLIDIVSKGGNYLLNVGPTAEGVIPQPSVERLLAMGAWLDVNGEAIYGTKPGPIQGQAWCRSTAKPGKVYLHVFDWPEGGRDRAARRQRDRCNSAGRHRAVAAGDSPGRRQCRHQRAGRSARYCCYRDSARRVGCSIPGFGREFGR